MTYKDFFEKIDEAVGMGDITCHDFSRLYFSFFEELKQWRCTSSGFTGLSELLVFRLIVNLLGRGFCVKPITKDVNMYVKGNIILEQGNKIKLRTPLGKQKSITPDLAIFENENLKSIISIKVYITDPKTLKNELEKISHLKKEYPELKALLLIFVSKASKTSEAVLKEYSVDKNWFKNEFINKNEHKKIANVVKFIL